MIIPYQVDVPLERWPISNYLIITGNIAIFILQIVLPESYFEPYVFSGWLNIKGWFGAMWLHADLLHLVGNMLFLWLFGNAVCAKVGNFSYPVIYVFLGLLAEMVHLIFDGRPSIGASGAINGVVGMYLVFYPLNSISCILLWFPYVKEFSLDSFWMILFWFSFDIWGTVSGDGGVAYMAHIGGFVDGFTLSIILLKCQIVQMDSIEKSLLEIWGWDKPFASKTNDETSEKDDGWIYIEPPNNYKKGEADR